MSSIGPPPSEATPPVPGARVMVTCDRLESYSPLPVLWGTSPVGVTWLIDIVNRAERWLVVLSAAAASAAAVPVGSARPPPVPVGDDADGRPGAEPCDDGAPSEKASFLPADWSDRPHAE